MDTAPMSKILFSQTREDPLIDMFCCRHTEQVKKRYNQLRVGEENCIPENDIKALLIGSGGESILSLLSLTCISRIDVVDMNPEQIQLIKLKILLMKYIEDVNAQLEFLGSSLNKVTEKKREEIFELLCSKIADDEEKETILFWKDRKSHILFGVNRVGRYEELFRELVLKFKEKNIPNPIEDQYSCLDSENSIKFSQIFEEIFERNRLIKEFGENAVNFSMSQSFGVHFSKVFKNALSKYDSEQNYFLSSIFRDCYSQNLGEMKYFPKKQMVDTFYQIDISGDGQIFAYDIDLFLIKSGFTFEREVTLEIFELIHKNFPNENQEEDNSESGIQLQAFLSFFRSVWKNSGISHLFPNQNRNDKKFLLLEESIWNFFEPLPIPPCYQNAVQKRIRKIKNFEKKIHFHQGPLHEMIPKVLEKLKNEKNEKNAKFDFIQTSNITDWISPNICEKLMECCRDSLSTQGVVLSRRLNGDYDLEETMTRTLSTEPSISLHLHQNDRSFFYTQLALGFHPLSISQNLNHSFFKKNAINFNSFVDPMINFSPFSIVTPTNTWLNPQELTDFNNFENAIASLEKIFDFSHHPYFLWLMGPSSTKEEFYKSQIPFRYAVEMWSNAVASVIGKSNNLEQRYKIFENLSEEHGHGNFTQSHKFTFFEFLNALGGNPDEYINEKIPIFVSIFTRGLIDFCNTHHFTAGSAALGMIESLYCQISEIITNSIFGKGWIKKGQQHHYEFHAEIDIEHARELLKAAKPGWENGGTLLKNEVAEGLVLAAQHFWQLYGNMFVLVDSLLKKKQKTSFKKKTDIKIKELTLKSVLENSGNHNLSQEEEDLPISLRKSQEHVSNNINNNNHDLIEKNEPKTKNEILKMGLQLISANPEKLTQFLQLGKNFLNLNVPSKGFQKLYDIVIKHDGWKIDCHKVLKWWRLIDDKGIRQAWGSESGFHRTFEVLLQANELIPQTSEIAKRLVIHEITSKDISSKKKYEPQLLQLEKGIKYPLGKDFFEIGHGNDYFKFFERLGEMYYWVVSDENSKDSKIAAVACGILRTFPSQKKKHAKIQAWYLCDLKVVPEYRGQKITLWIASKAAPSKYFICSRGYAISMNPKEGPNRVVTLLQKFFWTPAKVGCQLAFFSLTFEEMQKILPILGKRRGPISFLSLSKTKDIILQSTHQPLPLLHLQFGPFATSHPTFTCPQRDFVHMFCTPVDDVLYEECRKMEVEVNAMATVVQHRMEEFEWNFILTSDI